MKRTLLAILLFPLFHAGLLRAAAPTTEPTQFLRYIDLPDGSAHLEAAEAAYKNDAGVVVHLIAAIHIADTSFFAGLDESFDHYDALLYEMISQRPPATQPLAQGRDRKRAMRNARRPAPPPAPTTAPAESPPPSLVWISGSQMVLRDRLHLAFQLDEIDYTKPNFVHADLDMPTFLKLQSDRGESMLKIVFRSTVQNMVKSFEKGPDTSGLAMMGALFSRDQANELKRVFAVQFADLDNQMDAFEGPNGSVIIDERNKVALHVLDQQIALGRKYLGIFYGAAHLSRMEQSLEAKGFHKVGVTWRIAWEMAPSTLASPTTRPVQH